MKARAVGVAPTIPAVIAVEVVALVALVLFPPARAQWWVAVAIAVIGLVALLVTVRGRSVVGWLVALFRFWRRRRRGPVTVPAAVDIPHGSQLYGVRLVDDEAITMIAVSGQAYSPTVLTGVGDRVDAEPPAVERTDRSARPARRNPPGGHRHRLQRIARAARNRLSPVVQHAARRSPRRGAAHHTTGGTAGYRAVDRGLAVPRVGWRGCGGCDRTDRQRAAATRRQDQRADGQRSRRRPHRTGRGFGGTRGQP